MASAAPAPVQFTGGYPDAVSRVGYSRWSWIGLVTWLANATLVVTIAAGLAFGADLADHAWGRGIHVTPGQAAMHAALMAEGFAHHHGGSPTHQAAAYDGPMPSLQPANGGSTWGVPLLQAVDVELPGASLQRCCRTLPASQPLPIVVDPVPSTPPPEAA